MIDMIHCCLDRLVAFYLHPSASKLIHEVVLATQSEDGEGGVTIDYVSCLLWEAVDLGTITIDKHGTVGRGAASTH